MPRLVLLLVAVMFFAAAAPGAAVDYSCMRQCVRVEKNVMVPMRDGVTLATDIYFPCGLTAAPVILARTVYGKNRLIFLGDRGIARRYVASDYIFVVQDVRGRSKSCGIFYPFILDAQDGQDTIAWIKNQSWFNGKLGTVGPSFSGITQWLEAPGQDIDAMFFSFATPNLAEVIYTGGQLHLLTLFNWAMVLGQGPNISLRLALAPQKYARCLTTLPVAEADSCADGDIDYFNDSLDMDAAHETFKALHDAEQYSGITAPAVSVAGWYDIFLGPQLQDYMTMRANGFGQADQWRLVVGPWGHGPGGDGSVDFGDNASFTSLLGMDFSLQWFDAWLKGLDTGIDGMPPVTIFVMGSNVWRDEQEWPLARTVYTPYYLHSGGHANTALGDGSLSVRAPDTEEPSDSFTYDPLDPVPTRGGNNLITNLGPYNQADIEKRPDVLCYTTAALDSDIEVTGPLSAVLYATTDAADTDFTMKLVDVHPDGRAINIQDGIVRASFRTNSPDNPTPPVPGEVERYELDLWATSTVFKAGHRIRVEVSSSNFPRFNRNLNTGGEAATATKAVAAHQTIHHTAARPSHIVLPVIPP